MYGDLRIADGIYLIGGPNISHPEDATVFLVDCERELVIIDTGSGKNPEKLVRNIEGLYLDAHTISTVILTHCHIDHIGGSPFFKQIVDCTLIAHEQDAEAIETGDQVLTAASWYGVHFPPTHVDEKLTEEEEVLNIGGTEIHCLHTPGHTPGSISVYIDRDGKRVLFGQDIHGPFLPDFRSDIEAWKRSMKKLLRLEADILCEGHFGIFRNRKSARAYIMEYLNQY